MNYILLGIGAWVLAVVILWALVAFCSKNDHLNDDI